MTNQITRPQIRGVFMRNGVTIPADHDDLPDYVYESAFELLEMAAPAVQGEPVAWATRLYNTAYHAGHHDTVEGGYTHVYPQDMDSYHEDIVQEWLADNPQPAEQPTAEKFKLDDRVRKTKGSQWKGRVVGTYSTELTPEGYAVESETEKGSVQIYPAAALEMVGGDAQQPAQDVVELDPKDLIVQLWCSKPKSGWDYALEHGVKITHKPSGVSVTCDTERSMHANKNKALCKLQSQLAGWTAPDVAGMVEALEAISRNELDAQRAQHIAAVALAAHRKHGGDS